MTWEPITGLALLDPGLEPWLRDLNAIPGVQTLQSCNGNHPNHEGALLWLTGRMPDVTCRRIAEQPGIETVSILYNREPFPVTEIRFVDPLPSAIGEWLVHALLGESLLHALLTSVTMKDVKPTP